MAISGVLFLYDVGGVVGWLAGGREGDKHKKQARRFSPKGDGGSGRRPLPPDHLHFGRLNIETGALYYCV